MVAHTLITHYFPVFKEEIPGEPATTELQAAPG